MKTKDKMLKKEIDVYDKLCPYRPCYWPRQNPGVFQNGKGYQAYGDSRDQEWACGTRVIHGCPDPLPETKEYK